LVGSRQRNYSENATACSKRTLKTTVATQLKIAQLFVQQRKLRRIAIFTTINTICIFAQTSSATKEYVATHGEWNERVKYIDGKYSLD
jgi:hypothetical protein